MDLNKFIHEGLVVIVLLGGAMWLGSIWQAEGAEELEQACAPVEWVTEAQYRLVSGVVGWQPAWTLSFQRAAMMRCYYFIRHFHLSFAQADESYASGPAIRRF